MYDYSPLWQTMREMGITTYRLIKEGIDKKTLSNLQHNKNVTELTLEKLKDGERGVVERLTLTGPTKRRLIEMGITPGTEVRVLKRAPLGDPIEIYLRRYTLTLRAEDAHNIYVRRAEA